MDTLVTSAIADGVSQATAVINGNMPAVFGISVLFVAWAVGRRVLGKI